MDIISILIAVILAPVAVLATFTTACLVVSIIKAVIGK